MFACNWIQLKAFLFLLAMLATVVSAQFIDRFEPFQQEGHQSYVDRYESSFDSFYPYGDSDAAYGTISDYAPQRPSIKKAHKYQ